MSRINAVDEMSNALDAFKKKFGRVSNMFRHMAQSPSAVSSFLSMYDACEKTSLPGRLRHEIALFIAEFNKCQYCLAAHAQGAKMAHMTLEEINQARTGISSDEKSQAVLLFVKEVLEKRGQVSDAEVDALKKQGVTDQEIAEIILLISFYIFTTYFNVVAEPELDFPSVPKL